MRYSRPARTARSSLLLPILALAACAGTIDRRVDPQSPDAVGGANLRSYDLEVMTDQMARSIAADGILNLRQGDDQRSSFFIVPVVNESSDTINTSLLTTMVRTKIFKQLGRQVKIVDRAPEASDLVRTERSAKRQGAVTANPDRTAQVSGSDYVLKGRIQDRQLQGGSLRSAYYVVTYELTDLESQELVWTDDYRVKFESEKSVISR